MSRWPRVSTTVAVLVGLMGFLSLSKTTVSGVPGSAVSGPDSLVRIDGDVVLATGATEAWDLLTTPEGLSNWIAPEARVELELGGVYELYFFPDSTDRGMEGTRVLSYVPEEMLSYTGELAGTWVVWRFESLEPEDGRPRTRVQFTALGHGEEWEQRSVYFRQATPEVLDDLRAAAED